MWKQQVESSRVWYYMGIVENSHWRGVETVYALRVYDYVLVTVISSSKVIE